MSMIFETADGDQQPATGSVVRQYLADLVLAARRIDLDALGDLVEAIRRQLTAGGRLFIAGNGGSGAAAIHLASDWSAATAELPEPPLVLALNENVARLTAIANDYSYEEVFSRQLMERGREGDLLLLLSVSANSPNLVSAARAARKLGITVAAAVGNPGRLASEADHLVVFGDRDYGLTEDLHVALSHMVVRLFNGGAARRCAVDHPPSTAMSLR